MKFSVILLDNKNPWDFFDEACQGQDHHFWIGGVLFCIEIVFIKFISNVGKGRNSYDFFGFEELPKLARFKGL